MATITTISSAQAWSPDVVGVAPVVALPTALILTTSTAVGRVEGDEPSVRVAYADADDATITEEGQPIDEGEPDLAEVVVQTFKITKLLRLSREQFGQPNTAELLSTEVNRVITRKADQEYVGRTDAGLLDLAGTEGPAVTDSLDALVDLQSAVSEFDAVPTNWILAPSTWAALRKLREGADSNTSLLGVGAADAVPFLLDVPVTVSNAVPPGSGLLVDRTAIVSAVGDVMVAQSSEAYFASDSIGLRAVWRLGWNAVHPERIGKFAIATED